MNVWEKEAQSIGPTPELLHAGNGHEVSDPWQFPQQGISLIFAEHWTELRALLLTLHKGRERPGEGMDIYSVLNKWDKQGCK